MAFNIYQDCVAVAAAFEIVLIGSQLVVWTFVASTVAVVQVAAVAFVAVIAAVVATVVAGFAVVGFVVVAEVVVEFDAGAVIDVAGELPAQPLKLASPFQLEHVIVPAVVQLAPMLLSLVLPLISVFALLKPVFVREFLMIFSLHSNHKNPKNQYITQLRCNWFSLLYRSDFFHDCRVLVK